MAYLAVIASKCVNGVAKIHSGEQPKRQLGLPLWHAGSCCRLFVIGPPVNAPPAAFALAFMTVTPPPPPSHVADILKHDVFGPFHDIFPEKFQNKTNGVTPRRWLAFCNPPLRALITETLGNERWINDTDRLKVSAGLHLTSYRACDGSFGLFFGCWAFVWHLAMAAVARGVITGDSSPCSQYQTARPHPLLLCRSCVSTWTTRPSSSDGRRSSAPPRPSPSPSSSG